MSRLSIFLGNFIVTVNTLCLYDPDYSVNFATGFLMLGVGLSIGGLLALISEDYLA